MTGASVPRAAVGDRLRWGAMDFEALVAHTSTVRSSKPLTGQQGRMRVIFLVAEVGGRWSQESVWFLVQFAKANVRHEPKVMRVSVRCVGMRRWRCMLACPAAQVFAMSLLERGADLGSDGPILTTSEVVGDVLRA